MLQDQDGIEIKSEAGKDDEFEKPIHWFAMKEYEMILGERG